MPYDHQGGSSPYAQPPLRDHHPRARSGAGDDGSPVAPPEVRGCLFALSQPPLLVFLAVIGVLLFGTALHDLLLL